MKLSEFSWRILTPEEAAESDAVQDRRAWYESLGCLLEEQCVDDHGAHAWWLEIDPDDGITFICQRCPAGADYIYPDGMDTLNGNFEVFPGYVLTLQFGSVQVNGRETYGLFTYGWRGQVTADLHVERYPATPGHGEEFDVWIDLEAA